MSEIAQELDINRSDVQEMTTQLREGVVKKNRK
jgi:Mn-dependent DtxR family transcriptional regulator